MTLLKLRAADAEDLETIAACLQDSVIPMSEMAYRKSERRFALVANRFRWETAAGRNVEGRIYERVHCGVHFENVKAVRVRNLDLNQRSEILSLLTITAGDGVIDLVFSAGGTVRIEVDEISCHLEDFDEPWPTQWQPSHPENRDDG
jgi:hypothetical protein